MSKPLHFLCRPLTLPLSILFLFTNSIKSYSQQGYELEIAREYVGLQDDRAGDFVETRGGSYLFGASSNSQAGRDKGANSKGGTDFWLSQFNQLNTKEWDQTYGGSLEDSLEVILKTADNEYLLIGHSNSPAGIDKTEPSRGGFDFWIIKVDSTGSKRWDKTIGGSANDFVTTAIATSDGGYLIGGITYSIEGGDKRPLYYSPTGVLLTPDYWVVKIDGNGSILWQATFSGPETEEQHMGADYLTSLSETSDGYFIGGYSNSSFGIEKVDDNRCQSCVSSDFWIIKLGHDGYKYWDKVFGGTGDEKLVGIERNPNGGYVLLGTSSSGIGFEKSKGSSSGQYHQWVLGIDEDGNSLWDHAFAPESPQDQFTAENFVITEGGYMSTVTAHRDSRNFQLVVQFDWEGNILSQDEQAGADDFDFKSWDRINKFMRKTNDKKVLVGVTRFSNTFGIDFVTFRYIPKSFEEKAELSLYSDPHSKVFSAFVNTNATVEMVEFYANGVKFGEDNNWTYEIFAGKMGAGIYQIEAKVKTTTGKILATPVSIYTESQYNVSFYRGININGPTIPIDAMNFEGSDIAPNFYYKGSKLFDKAPTFNPIPNDALGTLLQSGVYNNSAEPTKFAFSRMDEGAYELYFYILNSNKTSKLNLTINNQVVVETLESFPNVTWRKVGPIKVNVKDRLEIKSSGEFVTYLGIELWKLNNITAFYRSVNVNGPQMTINNLKYESGLKNPTFSAMGKRFENQNIALTPATDSNRAKMIRSSIYSMKSAPSKFTFSSVPKGKYEAYLYVWEDNYNQQVTIKMGKLAGDQVIQTGTKGVWKVLGPFPVTSNGSINFEVHGGDGNISGVELLKTVDEACDIVPESCNGNTTENKIIVYPNSIAKYVKVKFSHAINSPVTLTLSNNLNSVILKKCIKLNGQNELQLEVPIEKMTAGVYYLKIQLNNETKVVRLIKE